VPKEKAQNTIAEVDDAGRAIVAQIRTAADLAKEDCDRAMALAHKLSMELRAAEDRTHEMEAEVKHWRERTARAEQWLATIQKEIEEKLLVSHLSEDTKTA
jgi:chromosome segregation ATPase